MAVTHGKFTKYSDLLIFRENSNPSLIKMTDFYGRSLDSGNNSGTNQNGCVSSVFLEPLTMRETKTLTWITATDRSKYLKLDSIFHRLWTGASMSSQGRSNIKAQHSYEIQIIERQRESNDQSCGIR